MADYREMWNELGLDLNAHDMLLEFLGKFYGDTFLTQNDRPEGMDYFNFVMSEIHGLRIKELMDQKAAGRKIIGAYCVFVPEELVLAANATLVGLCSGADFATDQVEQVLPRNTCALIKSAFGFKLGAVCPYLEAADLVVGENTCDGKKKAYEAMDGLIDNLYVMDLPQVKSGPGRNLMKAEFIRFKNRLEELTGVTITVEKLKESIAIVNAKRSALQRLAELRGADPAPISGLDALLVNQISFCDDPVRFTQSLNKICDELEQRVADQTGVFPAGTPRILISGCPMAVPNWKLPAIIESCGGVIAGEESCIGERGCRNRVSISSESLDELLDGIVDRYFKVDCAVFTPNNERVDHIDEMVQRSSADGVIHYGLQFCQPYLMEAMSVEKKLENKDIPVLRVETDYGTEDAGQLKTRVEAFIEQLRA